MQTKETVHEMPLPDVTVIIPLHQRSARIFLVKDQMVNILYVIGLMVSEPTNWRGPCGAATAADGM